jgi:hypothetical protein
MIFIVINDVLDFMAFMFNSVIIVWLKVMKFWKVFKLTQFQKWKNRKIKKAPFNKSGLVDPSGAEIYLVAQGDIK